MASVEPQPVSRPRWYDAYPAPRRKFSPIISRQELRDLLAEGKIPGRDIILIDLRREDHEAPSAPLIVCHSNLSDNLQGGTIRGSINLPAQSLYSELPTLYTLFRSAGENSDMVL
jgi:arsenical-resistance protein 2